MDADKPMTNEQPMESMTGNDVMMTKLTMGGKNVFMVEMSVAEVMELMRLDMAATIMKAGAAKGRMEAAGFPRAPNVSRSPRSSRRNVDENKH